MAIRRKKIRELTQKLLAESGITGSPVPVARIAKSQGARIFFDARDDDISGFLYSDDKRAVIGVNTQHPSVRQRFTIAHELGHLLLHSRDQVHVDNEFPIMLRSEASSQGNNAEEIEANLFAAELLMPEHFIEKDLQAVDTLDLLDSDMAASLANKYGVSTQALLIRLASLGYVTQ